MRSVAPALRLNPSKATWRCSTTSTGHLFSIRTSSLIETLWSTLLLNPPPLASTLAQCRNVGGRQAPGSIYAAIFSCDILRILFAFRLRAPNPCQGVKDVGYRCRWRISVKVIIGRLCVREDGRGKGQYAAAVHSQQALGQLFTAYREELERVEVFKYLGWLIAYNDANNQAMRSNLRKAHRCWAWVSCVLRAENASP